MHSFRQSIRIILFDSTTQSKWQIDSITMVRHVFRYTFINNRMLSRTNTIDYFFTMHLRLNIKISVRNAINKCYQQCFFNYRYRKIGYIGNIFGLNTMAIKYFRVESIKIKKNRDDLGQTFKIELIILA